MRFVYEYRTPDNTKHRGEVSASDRERAFASLKARGIRPSRLVAAPGVMNALLGRGKRWSVIVVLSCVCVIALTYAFNLKRETNDQLIGSVKGFVPRHQIEGIPPDWPLYVNEIFPDELDCILALHALPGVIATRQNSSKMSHPVDPNAAWVVALKQIVAGMREDAKKLLSGGWSVTDLNVFLDERSQMENEYREKILKRVTSGKLSCGAANSILTKMGLKGVFNPPKTISPPLKSASGM